MYDRALNPKMTLVCVLVGCLFPGEGYDQVLARAFAIPGLRFWPGPVPGGQRPVPGQGAARGARRAAPVRDRRGSGRRGTRAQPLWHGLEVTAIDGTTLELDRNDALACEFGSSADGARPLLRIVGHVRAASRRWIAAEIGTYHQGENELADGLLGSLRSGMVNLADRGFPSVERYLAVLPPRALTWSGA